VTVYCREKHTQASYLGVQLVFLPTIRHKYLDTLAHTCVSTFHLVRNRVDVALYCNAANAIFTVLPRVAGIPVALNVDGIERKRKKWNKFAKAWYLMSEWLATKLPNAIVTDAQAIQRYYLERYGANSTFIAYGTSTSREATLTTPTQLGLQPRRYFLYVSRMEPENRALEVRQAFERVRTDMKLALIGDAPYASEYIASVRETTDPRVVIPGAIFGLGYRELGSWCFAYVHATEVGGTHPALIEAMGKGCLVLYLDTAENREVCGNAGLPYHDTEGLTERMDEVLRMSEAERDVYRVRAVDRVRQLYDWEAVTTQYVDLLTALAMPGR